MFDPREKQADFPILQRQIHGNKRLVYLDNGATSQKPQTVLDAISNYYANHNANVHRGIHQLGDESTKLFHAARKTIAEFFGAKPTELVIVRNTTEALNMVAYAWGDAHIQAGDLILSTEIEHHSNLVPWQELAKRKNAQLQLIAVTPSGELDLQDAERKLKAGGDRMKVVAFTHVSNALGTLVPVEKLVALVRQHAPNAKIVIDGAQAAPHLAINFDQLDVDFYAVSAHKMLGPMGIGALLVKEKILQELSPFLFGGGMINEVFTNSATYAEDLEERFTAGTPDVAGLVGWAAACDYLKKIGMTELLAHDQKLVEYALQELAKLPQLKIVGPLQNRVGSVAFLYQGVHAHDVGQILDSEGVAVRSGHHCTMPLHTKFEWPATVRVSFQLYNTPEDIDVLITALKKVAQIFGK